MCITDKILNELTLPKLPKDDLKRVQRYINTIKELHGEFYLFGSFAKGSIKDSSDIDLLLLIDSEDRRTVRKLKLEYMNIIEDSVGEYYGESFDSLAYPKSVFENALELNKYYCLVITGGVPLEVVKQYIENQGKKGYYVKRL